MKQEKVSFMRFNKESSKDRTYQENLKTRKVLRLSDEFVPLAECHYPFVKWPIQFL